MNRGHAFLTIGSLLVSGCDRVLGETAGKIGEAEVTAGSDAGGLVRFSGVMAGIAFDAAQKHCWQRQQQSAVPTSFYKIGPDTKGRDQIMTFECKKVG
jgi:hypothetical protein